MNTAKFKLEVQRRVSYLYRMQQSAVYLADASQLTYVRAIKMPTVKSKTHPRREQAAVPSAVNHAGATATGLSRNRLIH